VPILGQKVAEKKTESYIIDPHRPKEKYQTGKNGQEH
jgi:hypothetical protein